MYLKYVENVIPLSKLIGLLFLFCLPHLSILFLKTKRNDLARPVMGTIFLVYIYIYMLSVCRSMSVECQINCVGGIKGGPRSCSKSFLAVKQVTPCVIHFLYARALAWTKKKLKKSVHLETRNLKLTKLQRLKNRGKKG